MKSKLSLGLIMSALFAFAILSPLGVSEANAQVGGFPCTPFPACLSPPPGGGSGGSPSPVQNADTANHSGNKWKVTTESVIQMQGYSVACSALVNIGDSQIKARGKIRRELTPVEAVNNSARCLFIPALIVAGYNKFFGIEDNACSRRVARRALRENNSRRARQELLWDDGSWERRQAKFLAQYQQCYRKR